MRSTSAIQRCISEYMLSTVGLCTSRTRMCWSSFCRTSDVQPADPECLSGFLQPWRCHPHVAAKWQTNLTVHWSSRSHGNVHDDVINTSSSHCCRRLTCLTRMCCMPGSVRCALKASSSVRSSESKYSKMQVRDASLNGLSALTSSSSALSASAGTRAFQRLILHNKF